jgi:hypothetical protein
MALQPRRRAHFLSPLYLARRRALYKGVLGGNQRWLRVGWIVGFLPPGRALRVRSFTRLLSQGSTGWLSIGIALTLPGMLRRTVGRTPQRAASVRLDPDTAMSIRTFGPPSRRERRRARRTTV